MKTQPSRDELLRAAHARLDRAIEAHGKARREDNRLKTEASKRAREAAVTELALASSKSAELMRKEFGL